MSRTVVVLKLSVLLTTNQQSSLGTEAIYVHDVNVNCVSRHRIALDCSCTVARCTVLAGNCPWPYCISAKSIMAASIYMAWMADQTPTS